MKEEVKQIAEFFKALGDPNRLRIIRMLASHPKNSLCVADLAERLEITQPAVSQHLRVLKNAGILEGTKEGYRVYYHANVEVLQQHRERASQLFEMLLTPCDECCSNACDD